MIRHAAFLEENTLGDKQVTEAQVDKVRMTLVAVLTNQLETHTAECRILFIVLWEHGMCGFHKGIEFLDQLSHC